MTMRPQILADPQSSIRRLVPGRVEVTVKSGKTLEFLRYLCELDRAQISVGTANPTQHHFILNVNPGTEDHWMKTLRKSAYVLSASRLPQ